MKLTITEVVDIRFTIVNNNKYGVTKCGRVFNIDTKKELKRKVVSGTYGYYISGKFKSLKYLRGNLVKLEKIKLPF